MAGLSRRAWGATGLGIALGGFFDGILLHQVLQWHHLLSALESDGWMDLRSQVLADGLFHAAMYAVALVSGVALLAPDRGGPPAEALRTVIGRLLIGFACWHLLDAVLAHGLLGLHRIRMDTDHPLAWDLGWLAVFGGLPAWLGLRALRRSASDDESGPGSGPGAARRPAGSAGAASLVALVAVSGAVALTAPWAANLDRTSQLVLRAPGTAAGPWLQSLAHADARWVWMDARATVAVVRRDPLKPLPGWRDGVWPVGGRLAAIACAGQVTARP